MKNTKGLYDLEVLNGLRVIVAFMIVLFHYNKLTGGSHAAINLPLYSVLKIAYVNGGHRVIVLDSVIGYMFCILCLEETLRHVIMKPTYFLV